MGLEIDCADNGNFRVLRLVGRLDAETSADFELAVDDWTAADGKLVVVDLAGVSYISSDGLMVLVILIKRGWVHLGNLSSEVREVFDLNGIDPSLFPILPDAKDALLDLSPDVEGNALSDCHAIRWS